MSILWEEMMDACTCPQERHIAAHKEQTDEWWQSPAYRAISDRVLEANPACEYCGRPSEVVHHDEDWMYATQEAYNDPANMTPACHACHDMYRRGFVICPVCLAKGEYHYMVRGRERCSRHEGTRRGVRKRRPHPCGRNRGRQRCFRNGHMVVCARSPQKARGCDHFKERGAVQA